MYKCSKCGELVRRGQDHCYCCGEPAKTAIIMTRQELQEELDDLLYALRTYGSEVATKNLLDRAALLQWEINSETNTDKT